MEISSRKSSKRMHEPVDEWLQNEGYFRKHAPRDPTCLFRAFSEQVYNTQFYHTRVRKECVEFMKKMKHMFEENITIPYDCYLEQMGCFTEWGGMNEIQAMSLLYKREVIILNGQKQMCKAVTDNGFKDKVYLCFIPPKQYESVYTGDYIGTAAFCQSLVYGILYKDVFNMSNVEDTVYKMLHDRNSNFRHDKFFQKGNLAIREQLAKEMYSKVTETDSNEYEDAQELPKVFTPFPYRIAKALDPYIYRNTDFDIWHEIKREVKNAGWTRYNSDQLQVGGKCLIQINFDLNDFDKVNNNDVHLDNNEKDPNANEEIDEKCKMGAEFYYGHIQEISKNNSRVVVFIEDLGEKRVVPYDALKPLPVRKAKQSTWQPMCRRNVLLESNQKWRKGINTNTRRTKEPINMLGTFSNPIDRNINSNIHTSNTKGKDATEWKDESSNSCFSKENHHSTLSTYTREKCANYGSTASANVFPGLLENAKPHVIKSIHEDIIEGCKQSTTYIKNNNDEDAEDKNNNRSASVTTETSIQVYTHSKQRLQKEIYYPPQSDNSNVCNIGQDGSPYSLLPYIPINFGEPISSSQMDRIMRYLNSSTQKNVDAKGSDLPLSDPFALRFFYNIGLEYFRASHALNFALNGQPSSYGWYYNTQVNNNLSVPQSQKGSEYKQDTVECNNGPKEIGGPEHEQKTNGIVNNCVSPESQLNEFQQGESVGDKPKNYNTLNKDVQKTNKIVVAPRFKKNADSRYRNNSQQGNWSQQHQTSYARPPYQHRNPAHNSPNPQDGNNDNVQGSHPNQMMPQTQLFSPNYTPYVQQTVYGTVPCYMSDVEPFGNPCYVPNSGFHSVPLIPHPDILEGINQQACSPQMCPSPDNYPQAFPPMYPYMLPQQVPYNNFQPNVPESWYSAPFQTPPQYYPYTIIPPNSESCNGIDQNMQNVQNSQNSLS